MTADGHPTTSARMPALFLSHGAPSLADDLRWPDQLHKLADTLSRPKAVLIVSAHWEHAPVAMSATSAVPLVYDFWGFPEKYYEVTYAAPGAPELASSVSALLSTPAQTVTSDESRGLDHGAYVPLAEMYPAADVPVLQLSMPSLDPERLLRTGRKLAPLRDEGVLIIGSGFTTHNLSCFNPYKPSDLRLLIGAPTSTSGRWKPWRPATSMPCSTSVTEPPPAASLIHAPNTSLPLFVALGAAEGQRSHSVIDGFWYGLSKRSWVFEN